MVGDMVHWRHNRHRLCARRRALRRLLLHRRDNLIERHRSHRPGRDQGIQPSARCGISLPRHQRHAVGLLGSAEGGRLLLIPGVQGVSRHSRGRPVQLGGDCRRKGQQRAQLCRYGGRPAFNPHDHTNRNRVLGALVWITEYATSIQYRPVKHIAQASASGRGKNIIAVMVVSMRSNGGNQRLRPSARLVWPRWCCLPTAPTSWRPAATRCASTGATRGSSSTSSSAV